MHILCTICTDLVNPAENLHATNCGHLFHHHCLTEWIERSSTCPQCRRLVTHSCIFRVYPTISDETPREVATLQAKLDEATRALQIFKDNEELLKVYTLELDTRNYELESLKLRLDNEQASLQRCKDLNHELERSVTLLTGSKKMAEILNNELSQKLENQGIKLENHNVETMRWRNENNVLKKNIQILKKILFKAEFEKNELRKKQYTADHACIADKFTALSLRLKLGQLSQKNLVRTLVRIHAVLLATQQTNNNKHNNDIVEKLSKMLAEGVILGPKLSENNNNTENNNNEVEIEASKINTNVAPGSQFSQNPSSDELMKEQASKIVPNRTVFESTSEIAINELVNKPTSEIVPNGAKPKTSEELTISRGKPLFDLSNISKKQPTKEISSETDFVFASTSKQSINETLGSQFSQNPISSSSDVLMKEQTSKIVPNGAKFPSSPLEDEANLLFDLFVKGLNMASKAPSEGSSNGSLEPCSVQERLIFEPKSQPQNLSENRSACDEPSTKFPNDKASIFGAKPKSGISRDEKIMFSTGVLFGSKPQSENTWKIATTELVKNPTSEIVPNGAIPKTSEKLDITRNRPEKPLFELSNISKKQPTKEISSESAPDFVFASTSIQSTASNLSWRENNVKQRMSIPLEGSSTYDVFASTSRDNLNGQTRKLLPKILPESSTERSKAPNRNWREIAKEDLSKLFSEDGADSTLVQNSCENERDYHYKEFVKLVKKIAWSKTVVSAMPSSRVVSSQIASTTQLENPSFESIDEKPLFESFLKRFLQLKPQHGIKSNSTCEINGDEILSEKLKQFFESKSSNDRKDDLATQVFKFESTARSHARGNGSKETRPNIKTGQLKWSQLTQTSTLCDKEDLRRKEKKVRRTIFSRLNSRDEKFMFPTGVLFGSKPQSEDISKTAINELVKKPTSEIVSHGAIPKTSKKLVMTREKPGKPLFELSNISKKQHTKEISTEIFPSFVFASTSKQSTASTLDWRENNVKQQMSIPLEESSTNNVFASTSRDNLNGQTREFVSKGNPLRSKSLPRNPSNVTRDKTVEKPEPGKSKGSNFEMKPQHTKYDFGSKPLQPENPSNIFANNNVESTKILAGSSTEQSKAPNRNWREIAKEDLSKLFSKDGAESTSAQNSSENEWDYHYKEFVKSLKKIAWPKTFVSAMPSLRVVSSQIASTTQLENPSIKSIDEKPLFESFLKRFLQLKPQLGIKSNSACEINPDEILSEKLKQFFELKFSNHRKDWTTQVFKFETTRRSSNNRSKETRQNKKTEQPRWSQLTQTITLCDKEELSRKEKKVRRTIFTRRYPPVPFRFHP